MNATTVVRPLDPVVTAANGGRILDMSAMGHQIVCKVTNNDSAGAFSLAEVIAQTGGGVPLHVHQREEETFYILEGRFSFAVGDTMIEAGPGDTVYGPRQVAHSWFCTSENQGRMVMLVTPGDFENFLAELTTVPPPFDPAFEATMGKLCNGYGIIFGGDAASDNAPFAPAHVPAGAGRLLDGGDHRAWYKIESARTGGAFMLMEADADPNSGVPPYVHSHEDETFYVLAGRFQVQVGDQAFELGPGDSGFAPRNVMHTWRCVSDTPGRLLALSTPGANFEAFFVAMHSLGAELKETMANPETAAKFLALCETHGIEMIPTIK